MNGIRHLMARRERGFTMVAAIFLLVVLAALGAFMVTFSNAQHLSSAQDVQGERAYWAARSGLEWALASITATSTCPTAPTPFTVEGFTLTIGCTPTAYDEGGTTKTLYRITSTATLGTDVASPGYIERSVTATLEL